MLGGIIALYTLRNERVATSMGTLSLLELTIKYDVLPPLSFMQVMPSIVSLLVQ